MAANTFFIICSVLLALLVAWFIQVVKQSPIDPVSLAFPPAPPEEGPYAPNAILQGVERLGEGLLDGPEDIAVDKQGVIYATCAHDGWVQRLWPNGTWERWKYVGGNPLGIAVGLHGEILVCEPKMGLLNVTDEEVTVLSSEADGIQVRLADELVVASDGTIYYTDASVKFGLSDWPKDLLEGRANGRVLQYNPTTATTSVLLTDLVFPNGVALSSKEDFLIICETWKFRCLKYWLEGEKKGSLEIFIDNLPGGPDNIHSNGKGEYWVAQVKLRSPILEFVYKHPWIKHMAVIPFIWEKINVIKTNAAALKVREDGQPIVLYQDPIGKEIAFTTSALEVGDYLYLGSLVKHYIGRLKLT